MHCTPKEYKMSSILTNSSAMVALQTLTQINKNLGVTQGQISTGKKVDTARDNASVWAISQTMQSDVDGFKGINDALATGGAAVAVARTASESITGLLGQIKSKIVAAQDPSASQSKLQTDISELIGQIGSVVAAAQFNGLNLVNGTNASVDVLASLDRASDGSVSASSITVSGQDLSIGSGGAITNAFTGSGGTTGANAENFSETLDAAATVDIGFGANADYTAGDKLTISIGDRTATYTVTTEDVAVGNVAAETIAVGVADAIRGLGLTVNTTVDAGVITLTNDGADAITVVGNSLEAGAGGLGALSTLNVDNGGGGNAAAALAAIEGLIQTSIDAAAAFGSSQARIDNQSEFVSKLTDSLKTGIGALVDADMEEASARLQALQVQQQLATQSLSIANQAPQNILSLFR